MCWIQEDNMFKKFLIAMTISLFLVGIAITSEAAANNPVLLMVTSMGNVKIELFQKEAPISVKNFLSYVKDGFYNGTTFHRVIPGFMIREAVLPPA
jgi:peptidyl-prolyl cis-trans isomerase A (cyclophilin A)